MFFYTHESIQISYKGFPHNSFGKKGHFNVPLLGVGSCLCHTLTNMIHLQYCRGYILMVGTVTIRFKFQLFIRICFVPLRETHLTDIPQPCLKTHGSKQIHIFHSHYFNKCLTRQVK